MNANNTYVFHEDAGHGWLAVKRKELLELNIIKEVSVCSFEKGDTVYLEEDCDAALFIRAMEAKGSKIKYRESVHPDLSPIRRYAGFKLRMSEKYA